MRRARSDRQALYAERPERKDHRDRYPGSHGRASYHTGRGGLDAVGNLRIHWARPWRPSPPEADMDLTEHFTLEELTFTEHRSIDNRPASEVTDRLEELARNFLEPVRARFGPLRITSGYRCPDLNKAIGGARDSAHKYGCAADFQPLAAGVTVTDVVRWIAQDSGLPFDQVIDEGSSTAAWVHLGMLRPGHEAAPRRQALVMRNGSYSVFMGVQS